MLRKLVTATIIAAASLGCVATAHALDYPAAPVNAGPPRAPGIPLVDQSVGIVNAVTSPILQPILAPGGGVVAEPVVEGPVRHRHHHRHMMKKKMMKKAM